MAGSAKFASEELKALCQQRADSVAAGTEGPLGNYTDGAEYLPAELPTEAWALFAKSGYLMAAKSYDGMNGWYFSVEAETLPGYAQTQYPAEDNNGEAITVPGEAAAMAAFIAGTQPYFFINGERFTQTAERAPDGSDFFINCSGPSGRGALCHFDPAIKGISLFIYSNGKPVGTDERMGLDKTLPDFECPPVDSRALPGTLNAFTGDSGRIHWLLPEE